MDVDPWVEEVRVALALNGGVSLAVWMGGCAVELDEARRTRCASSPGAPPVAVAARTIYGALCDAFRRELVIDVMSGSSAGGINGALLAGAMANRRELLPSFVRERWLTLGDFSKLLHPLSVARPEALMQGKYFAEQLTVTFEKLLSDEPQTELPALVAALDVTTTDTTGRCLEFRDAWGGELYAREYRARFRFRAADDYDAVNLAAAARASASFPLAFEPFAVPASETRELAEIGATSWLVDGGLLDNAPIKAALALIPTRPATRQVSRFLCYLNGDPETPEAPATDAPTTRDVIGSIINLPRKAPVADHLMALQELARRRPIAHEAQLALLAAELPHLQLTAESLLESYRRRRRLRVMQDLLPQPGDAQVAFDAVEASNRDLPWLSFALDTSAEAWVWGFEAARRVHHLAIDLVRAALPTANQADRVDLLTVRAAIDDRLQELENQRESLAITAVVRERLQAIANGEDAIAQLAQLDDPSAAAAVELAPGIAATAADLFGVSVALGAQSDVPVGFALFGGAWAAPEATLSPAMLDNFRARVVAIEVVRRSFVDEDPVDDAQEIAFAQLTPDAPAPIFTAHPFTAPFPVSTDGKLCGTILGHFGGFYRSSWRANDFLWGRLDATARIVEMLVSAQRSHGIRDTDDYEPWAPLAAQLSEGARHSPPQLDLLIEALADLTPPVAVGPGGDGLEQQLLEVLRHDLTTGGGRITRVLCTRAAQFTILCEELPYLLGEEAKDLKAGCSPSALGLEGLSVNQPLGVLAAIHRLREAETVLPKALGRDSRQELTSDLAVRTVTRAGLVGLGLARQAGGRIASPVTPLRSLLLPLLGAVSRNALNRLGVAAAFGASALYLGARLTATDPNPALKLDELSKSGLLLAIVALLVVAGTALLPIARAVLGTPKSRVVQGVMGALLLIVGVGGGAIWAWGPGPLSVAHLVFAPAVTPPWPVTVLALALGAGAAFSAPKPLRRTIEKYSVPAWRGTSSLLLTFAAALLIAIWAQRPLREALSSDERWQIGAAVLAISALPLALLFVVVILGRPARPHKT